MTTYISMLRGINVGSQKKIRMKDLRDLYESLNFRNCQTYIQSGNVIFKFDDISSSKLSIKIEKQIKKVFGFDVPVFIRTKDELAKIIEDNPFISKENSLTKEDLKLFHVTFLSDSPAQLPIKEIDLIKNESEKFSIVSKEIYLFLPNGYARTKLSNGFFEKKLKVSATTRNWRTVNKLYDIAKET